MAAADHFEAVQKIYIAFYQRPADPAGLRYWADRIDVAGGDTAAVMSAFATSEEATALYGPINEETIGEVINGVYQALFGRDPDEAGRAYYEAEFSAGNITAGNIALAILNAAQNDDVIAVNNKLAVANVFTQQVAGRNFDDPNFGQGGDFPVTYAGEEDAVAARAILAGVTADPNTVLTPEAVAQALQDQIADEGETVGGIGSSFTLTTNVDSFVGTSGNDTFQGIQGTLTELDNINGGTGNDTLNLFYSDNSPVQVPASATVTNIETINIARSGAEAGVITVAGFEGATAFWQSGTDSNVLGLGEGQTAGFRGTDGGVLLSYQDDVETASIALEGVEPRTTGSTFDISGTGLTTVSISGSTAGEADADPRDSVISLVATTASEEFSTVATEDVETVQVALTSNASVALTGFTNLATFDASGSTGDVYAQLWTAPELETVTMGSGDDIVAMGEQDDVTIGLGTGNDIVYVSGSASGNTITLGDGNDAVQITSQMLNVAATEGEDFEDSFEDSITSIADFNGTQDVLAFLTSDAGAEPLEGASTLVGEETQLNNAQIGEIGTSDTLYDALQVVAGAIGDAGWTTFQYGGSTYVFQNAAGNDAFGAEDGLVQLVGYTGGLNDSNFLTGDSAVEPTLVG